MFGKRFENDLRRIKDALATEKGEEDLRARMTAFVEATIDQFMAENGIDASERGGYANAAWTHFRLAMKGYAGRAELMLQGKNDVYYFSSYLSWFLRQGMTEFRNSRP